MVEPQHLRLDLSLVGSRALAVHDEECPDIGPICAQRNEPPQRHHTTLWAFDLRLLGEWGLRDGLAVEGILPVRLVDTRTRYTDLQDRTLTLDYANIHHHDGLLAGLGDAQVLLHGARKLGALAVGARLGASLPFGTVHDDPFRLAAQGLPHEHIQFGTGTVDPVASLDLSLGPVSAWGGLQAPLYEGGTGYRAGVRSNAGLAVSRPVGPVTLRLGAQVLHEQPERWHGHVPTDDGNRGRTDVYVAPGVTWNFTGEWMLNADVRVRAYSHVVDAQLDLPVVLELGLGRLYHFESEDEPAPAQGDVLEVDGSSLAPVAGKRFTIYDFWATWCEACKPLDAALRKLAAERSDLAIRRVQVEDADKLPRVHLVRGDGTVLLDEAGPTPELLEKLDRLTR